MGVIENGLVEGLFAFGDDAAHGGVTSDVDRGAHHVEQAVDADGFQKDVQLRHHQNLQTL